MAVATSLIVGHCVLKTVCPRLVDLLLYSQPLSRRQARVTSASKEWYIGGSLYRLWK
jgi:hypothetical protein